MNRLTAPILTSQMTAALNKVRNSGPKYRTDRIRLAVALARIGGTEAQIAKALGITPERAAAIAEIVTWERKVVASA